MENISLTLIGLWALITMVTRPGLIKVIISYIIVFAISLHFDGIYAVEMFVMPFIALAIGCPMGLLVSSIVRLIKNLFR